MTDMDDFGGKTYVTNHLLYFSLQQRQKKEKVTTLNGIEKMLLIRKQEEI